MNGGGRSICSMTIGGDLLSMSLSDIDDLLPNLSDDDETFDLLFLRTKTQAERTASAAPTKMQPIAMPIVWARESPDLTFDEGEVVCTPPSHSGVAVMVGEDKLSLLGVRGVDALFVGTALDKRAEAVRANEVDMPSLVVVDPMGNELSDALNGGDAFMNIVSPSEPLKTIAVGIAIGRLEEARFALSWKVTNEI